MTDSIYRGVLEFAADDTAFSGAMGDMSAAAAKMESATEKAATKASAAVKRQGDVTEREAKRIASEAARLERSIIRQGERAGRSQAEYLEYRARALDVFDRPGVAQSIARIRESEQVVTNLGMSAKQTAAAMRMVPAQITDIVTGLVSGQPAYMVAIQQGGQLKDSFGGIVPAAKALASIFTPLRIAMGAGVGAAVALAYAYRSGAAESDAYNRALILTGGAAGVTATELHAMAASLDGVVGTQSDAAKALTALAATGRVAGRDMERVGEAIVRANRMGVASAADLAKQYAELGRDPLQASIRLNESHRHLTLTIYEQIKALEEVGNRAAAASVAQTSLADTTNERMVRLEASLDLVAAAWLRIKSGASEAWDMMRGTGRHARTPLQEAEDVLAGMRSGRGGRFAASEASIREQEAKVAALRAVEEATRAQQAGIEATRENARWTEAALTNQQRINRELTKYRANVAAINAARAVEGRGPLSAAQIAREEAAIRKQFADRQTAARDTAAQRMLDQLRETEASLSAALEGEQKLGTAARGRVEFERQVADLKTRDILTADQKSLLSQEAVLRAQLEKNEAIEVELEMRDLIARKQQEERIAEERFRERSAQLTETLNAARGSRREQYDRALGSVRASDAARDQIADAASIYREHQRAQAELLKNTPKWKLGSDEYIRESMRIKASLDAALADQKMYYEALAAAQADWTVGASRAFNNYLANAANAAATSEDMFTKAFKGAEDAIVRFVRTGKLEFSDLIDSIIEDMIRAEVQAMASNIFGTGTGTGSGGGGGSGNFMGTLFNILGPMLGGSTAAAAGTAAATGIGYGTAGTAAATAFAWFAGVPVPVLDRGMDYVPYDGMPAILHKGERVMTAEENRSGGGGNITIHQNLSIGAGVSYNEMIQALAVSNTHLERKLYESRRSGGWNA